MPSEASVFLLRTAEYLYHFKLPNFATRGTSVMPAVPVWTVSSHWSNIDLMIGFGPDVFLAQQHKFCQKFEEAFYWVEQQLRFALKICIACLHVGQMLFAGNKYLPLKRITVHLRNVPKVTRIYEMKVHRKMSPYIFRWAMQWRPYIVHKPVLPRWYGCGMPWRIRMFLVLIRSCCN